MDLSIKDIVRRYLVNFPALRDDDYKLIANIWHNEIFSLEITSAKDFLKAYADQRLTNAESIRRSRAALQQRYEHLRGELYAARHEAEAPIIDELNTIKNAD